MSAIGDQAESTLLPNPIDLNTESGRLRSLSELMAEFLDREAALYIPASVRMNLAWAAAREVEKAGYRKPVREEQWPKYDH